MRHDEDLRNVQEKERQRRQQRGPDSSEPYKIFNQCNNQRERVNAIYECNKEKCQGIPS